MCKKKPLQSWNSRVKHSTYVLFLKYIWEKAIKSVFDSITTHFLTRCNAEYFIAYAP